MSTVETKGPGGMYVLCASVLICVPLGGGGGRCGTGLETKGKREGGSSHVLLESLLGGWRERVSKQSGEHGKGNDRRAVC